MIRHPRALVLALLAIFAVGCESQRIDPIEPVPVPVDPVEPKPKPDPVDPNAPPLPAATWEQVLKVQKGLTMAEVRAALGVDPTFSSTDTTTGNVVSDYRTLGDAGQREYLSVTFTAGVVADRVRIPRAK